LPIPHGFVNATNGDFLDPKTPRWSREMPIRAPLHSRPIDATDRSAAPIDRSIAVMRSTIDPAETPTSRRLSLRAAKYFQQIQAGCHADSVFMCFLEKVPLPGP
jgi:hypothetical protein